MRLFTTGIVACVLAATLCGSGFGKTPFPAPEPIKAEDLQVGDAVGDMAQAGKDQVPDPTEIAALLKQLNDDDYHTREAAMARLWGLPAAALEPVEKAAKSTALSAEAA